MIRLSFKKSQVAIEFFIFVGIALLIAIVFSALTLDQVKEYYDKKEYLELKDIALKTQKEVFLASVAKEGYERAFTLPTELDNKVNYTIIIKNNDTLITYSKKSLYAASIPKVVGNITFNNIITKSGGVIYLN